MLHSLLRWWHLYIYIYIHINAYVYICTYVYVHVYVYIHIYICTCYIYIYALHSAGVRVQHSARLGVAKSAHYTMHVYKCCIEYAIRAHASLLRAPPWP